MSNSVATLSAISAAVNALAIVGHKTLSVVAIDVSGPFTLSRANKAGDKVVVRDVAGLMLSGNPAERGQAFAYMMAHAWVNGMFTPIVRNVARVWPTINEALGIVGIDAQTGLVAKDAGIDNRAAWERVFDVLNKSHATKPFKGEKLAALIGINSARLTLATIKALAQADKDAALAAGTVAGVVDGETTVIGVDAQAALTAPVADDSELLTLREMFAAGMVTAAEFNAHPAAVAVGETVADETAQDAAQDAAGADETAPADADSLTA